ncbi:MAG: hypothetical protein KAQ87_00050 [Candidatus Pacebacteria bacterium]|nr:hypothetical protein [Candidatus Paceibacterota bacterium]
MFLQEYEKELKEISIKENLFCLNDFEKVEFDKKNSLGFASTISETRKKFNNKGDFDLLIHDLIYSVPSDIKFSLSNVFLYSKYANNFLKEIVRCSDKTQLSTYFKKREDKRFFYYVNSTFEKLYNFWDRIGDLLELSFNINLPEKSIYFPKVINELNKRQLESNNFSWLKDFKNGDYKNYLNKYRIKIVHYRQQDTYFFFEWLNSMPKSNHLEIIAKLQEEKDRIPVLLKKQLNNTNQGFENTIRLIKDFGVYEQ